MFQSILNGDVTSLNQDENIPNRLSQSVLKYKGNLIKIFRLYCKM